MCSSHTTGPFGAVFELGLILHYGFRRYTATPPGLQSPVQGTTRLTIEAAVLNKLRCILHRRYHKRFQEFIRRHRIYAQRVELGRFGSESAKPVTLYSNQPFVGQLPHMYVRDESPKSEGVCDRWTAEDGKIGVRGAGGLKQTQAYPLPFTRALAQLYGQHRGELVIAAQEQQLYSDKVLRIPTTR